MTIKIKKTYKYIKYIFGAFAFFAIFNGLLKSNESKKNNTTGIYQNSIETVYADVPVYSGDGDGCCDSGGSCN